MIAHEFSVDFVLLILKFACEIWWFNFNLNDLVVQIYKWDIDMFLTAGSMFAHNIAILLHNLENILLSSPLFRYATQSWSNIQIGYHKKPPHRLFARILFFDLL